MSVHLSHKTKTIPALYLVLSLLLIAHSSIGMPLKGFSVSFLDQNICVLAVAAHVDDFDLLLHRVPDEIVLYVGVFGYLATDGVVCY